MSSDQAATLVEADTVVIPTTSIPKGIAALFQYDPSSSLEDNHSYDNSIRISEIWFSNICCS